MADLRINTKDIILDEDYDLESMISTVYPNEYFYSLEELLIRMLTDLKKIKEDE